MPSHFEAARGAYVVRDYRPDQPRGGTVIVQGTSAMVSVIKLLPELDAARAERQDRLRDQPASSSRCSRTSTSSSVLTAADRADSTVITTQALRLMHDWLFNDLADEYALSSDWDNRWRTGGMLDELIDEAHLSPRWVLEGIERFVRDRDSRLARLQARLDAARGE